MQVSYAIGVAKPLSIYVDTHGTGQVEATQIERAVAEDDEARARAESEAKAEGRTLPPREGVSLRQRAWPMIEMMKRAHADGKEIVWGV